jgi:hypothetical protein
MNTIGITKPNENSDSRDSALLGENYAKQSLLKNSS